MEEKIETRLNDPHEGQIFRIIYKIQDFQIKLLRKSITKEVAEIEILLDGLVQKLVKHNGKWEFEESDKDLDFAQNIWRAISLLYRL